MSEPGCSWPGCSHGRTGAEVDEFRAVVLQMPGEDPFCLCHVGEDCLPQLAGGRFGECARCGKGVSTVTRAANGFPGGVNLHEECRRTWAMAQSAQPPRGAYARRAAQRGGAHGG